MSPDARVVVDRDPPATAALLEVHPLRTVRTLDHAGHALEDTRTPELLLVDPSPQARVLGLAEVGLSEVELEALGDVVDAECHHATPTGDTPGELWAAEGAHVRSA